MNPEEELAELAKDEEKIAKWIRYLISEDKKQVDQIKALQDAVQKLSDDVKKVQDQQDVLGKVLLTVVEKQGK